MIAYDSPVWFYVLMVPVFLGLGTLTFVMAYVLWKERDRL